MEAHEQAALRAATQEIADEAVARWYPATGIRIEYPRELAELEFQREPESCGFVSFRPEVLS